MKPDQDFDINQNEDDCLRGLPYVSDEMLATIIEQTAGHVMSQEEREQQMVGFVWGNNLEGGSTWAQVCEHLNVPLD